MGKNLITKKKSNSVTIVGILSLVLAAILIVIFMLQGKTETIGKWSGEQTSESLTCKATNKPFDIYKSNSALNDTTQVNAVFIDSRISSISLLRKTTYADAITAKTQSDAMEFAVNDSFGRNGLKAYALAATFNSNDAIAQLSFYATDSEINDVTIKYFMLEYPPNTIDEYQLAYQRLGFDCRKQGEK